MWYKDSKEPETDEEPEWSCRERPLFSFVVVSILISAGQVIGEKPTLLVVVLIVLAICQNVGGKNLKRPALRSPVHWPSVQQFLMALYGEDHGTSVLLIPHKIREACMDFNHFVPTDENLTPEVIPGLLHDLLRRSAAMQLAHNQPTYDKLIPIYFGNPDEPFKVSCCGVILVQDKNKDQTTTPRNIFGEAFTEVNPEHKSQLIPKAANSQDSIRDGSYFVLNEMINPVLFLLFDLGIVRKPKATSALVQVSRTSGRNRDIWAIHSRGHDRTAFGCLEHMRCGDNSEKFFTSLEAERNV